MCNLSSKKSLRLFAISESPNEANKLYELESFDDDGFNQVFDETEINERLTELVDHIYGGGSFFEITDDEYDSDGNLSISINDDDRMDLKDLAEQINVDPEKATCYILVDRQYREFCWIVAEEQGVVYTDLV